MRSNPMRSFLLAVPVLAALFVPSSTLRAQEPGEQDQGPSPIELQQQVDELEAQLAAQRETLLRPLVVNGVEVPMQRVQRELIYLVGSAQIQAKIAEFLTQEFMEQQIANGREAEEFEISDEEVLADVQGLIEQLRSDPETRDVDLWDAVRAQYGLDREQFLSQRRSSMLFDRVFFPGPCENWPDITVEAVKASSFDGNGEEFWLNMIRDSKAMPGGRPPEMWLNLCRQWVTKSLRQWSEIRYPADGLPADVCLQVNDFTWSTDEAFERIKSGVFLQDLERAVTEVAIREGIRQELEANDALIDDATFKQLYDEFSAQFEGTIFTVEVVVTNFQRYPSLEAFRARWRLLQAYKLMIADEFTEENLQAHAQEFVGFFQNGKVNVQVIPFLARDRVTAGWVANGMESARERAEVCMKELESGATFEAMMRKHGEFFPRDEKRGRLGAVALNQLRQSFREGEFTDLLTGFSAAKTIFYDAPVGQATGPIRSSDSYYIVQVLSRSFSNGRVNLQDERVSQLVNEDFLQHRFQTWAEGVIARTEVK